MLLWIVIFDASYFSCLPMIVLSLIRFLSADERRGFRLLGRRRAFHLHRSAVATALVAEAGSIGEFIVTALGTCFHACSLFSSVSLSASSPATACSTAEATSHRGSWFP